MGGGDLLNLDNLNIQRQTQAEPQHLINFPLSESNMQVIDEHMFSNLSIHDNDNDTPNDDPQVDGPNNTMNVSVSNIPPEFPVLTFSAMMSSADLEGADGRSSNS